MKFKVKAKELKQAAKQISVMGKGKKIRVGICVTVFNEAFIWASCVDTAICEIAVNLRNTTVAQSGSFILELSDLKKLAAQTGDVVITGSYDQITAEGKKEPITVPAREDAVFREFSENCKGFMTPVVCTLWETTHEDLWRTLERLYPYTEKTDKRLPMKCFCFDIEDNVISALSTHRIASRHIDWACKEYPFDSPRFLIPRELYSIVNARYAEDSDATLSLVGRGSVIAVRIDCDMYRLVMQIEDCFNILRVKDFMPKEKRKYEFVTDGDNIITANNLVWAASKFADRVKEEKKLCAEWGFKGKNFIPSPLKLSFEREFNDLVMTIEGTSKSKELAPLRFEIRGSGNVSEDFVIGVNPLYFYDLVNNIDAKSKRLTFNTNTDGIYVEDGEYRYYVLPVRLIGDEQKGE